MIEKTNTSIHKQLVELARRNDRKAQSELYQIYSKAMYNTSLRIVSDTFVAEDLLHDSFIDGFKNIGSFQFESTFGAWLKRIVINKSINYLKKKQLIAEKLEDYSIINENLDDQEANINSIEKIKYAMNYLAPNYKVVFSLYMIEGYDHEEIASIMNITSNTSRSQLTRAKSRIRQILKHEEKLA